jgi:hypothetical protein
MCWYTAVLVRGAHVNGVLDDERLGDMLSMLVEATDAEDAHRRALELGRTARDTYEDEDGTTVTLAFVGLADLMAIAGEDLGHGVEVYSQILPTRASEMVVPKEELAVFEAAEDADQPADESA